MPKGFRVFSMEHQIFDAMKMEETDKGEKEAGILTALSIFIFQKTNLLHFCLYYLKTHGRINVSIENCKNSHISFL